MNKQTLREKLIKILGTREEWERAGKGMIHKIYLVDAYESAIDQILSLFSSTIEGVIGEAEDEKRRNPTMTMSGFTTLDIEKQNRNKLKKEQRQRLAELMK